MLPSRGIRFFINIESCEVMMTVNHNLEWIFKYIFSILKHLVMKLVQLIDIVVNNIFKDIILHDSN